MECSKHPSDSRHSVCRVTSSAENCGQYVVLESVNVIKIERIKCRLSCFPLARREDAARVDEMLLKNI